MWQPSVSISWPCLYALDLLAIAFFVVSYFRAYRKGYRIDFWNTQLFVWCVFPNLIMLPFAKSDLNVIVLGSDLPGVVSVLPTVFVITLIGYAALWCGSGLWRLHTGVGMRKTAKQILDVVPRCSLMLMSSRRVLVFQATLGFFLQLSILAIYFSSSGFAFDLRAYTFANPILRPIALVISSYSIVIASHCLARYLDTKERVLLFCTLGLTPGLAFFGARADLAAIYINVLLCYWVMLRNRISLFRIVTLASAILLVGFYLGSVRGGDFSLGGFFASFITLVFYGNTFSDLRDFAWVYSAWDHVLWGGKTYIAALTSFIPRFASHFRDTWGLGVVTASTVGFDPQIHPGLRPGIFGEGFFNFGLPGVILVGLLVGIILRRVDLDVKGALAGPHPSMMKAFASTMLLGVASAVAVSAGFSALYTLAGIYFFSWVCLSVERMFHPARSFAVPNNGAILS